MITYSGRSVWPTNTTQVGVPNDVGPSLEDIAVGLGRQSRFAGQTVNFYTVLCHSLVSGEVAVEMFPDKPMLARWMRLHDAHESMISDVPTTWKNPMTRDDEAELDRRIALEHGLEPLSEEDHALLKMIDAACLAAEAHALGHREAWKWWPEDRWDAATVIAHRKTIAMILKGRPKRYLDPSVAIRAFKNALEGRR